MNAQPWLKSYPAGVRWDAPIEPPPVQSVLAQSARRFGPLPALQFMDKRIPYAELEALSDRAAAGFQKLGVGPGVHVGLYLPNTPHYPIAFFGVLKAGGTVVNYSPLDALRTLELKIEDSETDILVTLDLASLYPQAEKLLASTRLKTLDRRRIRRIRARAGPGESVHDGAEACCRRSGTTSASSRSATSSTTTGATRPIPSAIRARRLRSSSTPAARPARPKARC